MKTLKSPLNYAGSKHDLMPQLLEHFPNPESVDRFYDVFAGGLSVSINSPYNRIIANDIIQPLIDFYTNLKSSSDSGMINQEVEKIKSHAVDKDSQENYLSVREEFNNNPNPYQFFALVSSCTNNMMRFNKSFKFNQSFGKRTINDSTIQKLKDYCGVLKEKDIRFVCGDYNKLFQSYPPNSNDFVYLDPPYGIISEAGYNSYWSKQHEDGIFRLIDDLHKGGIRFALSGMSVHKGVDNPNLDKLSSYKIIELEHNYDKVARKKNSGSSQEILVVNY